MAGARIKGAGIEQAVLDVRRLLDEGRLSREEVEVRLAPEDLALLDEKILGGAWYPNESHRRLTELLRDAEGRGRDAYVVQRGYRTAERLLEAGLYRQLQLARDARVQEGEVDMTHAIRIMLSLSGALYDFGRWELVEGGDPDHLVIEVRDAAQLSDMNRLTAQGFIDCIARRISPGRRVRVTSRRPDADRVQLTIDRD